MSAWAHTSAEQILKPNTALPTSPGMREHAEGTLGAWNQHRRQPLSFTASAGTCHFVAQSWPCPAVTGRVCPSGTSPRRRAIGKEDCMFSHYACVCFEPSQVLMWFLDLLSTGSVISAWGPGQNVCVPAGPPSVQKGWRTWHPPRITFTSSTDCGPHKPLRIWWRMWLL